MIFYQKINRKNLIFFFFDPPYADLHFIDDIRLIKDKKIFEINHIIIIHRERRSLDDFKGLLKIIEIKEYGRSKIIFGTFI